YADLDSLANFIFSQDMNVTSNYEQVKSKLDVESYADYFIAELFYNNLDWPHNNLKIWRDRLYHPKWRYLLFDLDGAFTYHGWVPAEYDMLDSLLNHYGVGKKHAQIFKSMLTSDEFRSYFITRYADLLNTTWSVDFLLNSIEKQKEILEPEMPYHLQRWGIPMEVYRFETNERIPDWSIVRPGLVRTHIERQFDLVKQVELHINVYPP